MWATRILGRIHRLSFANIHRFANSLGNIGPMRECFRAIKMQSRCAESPPSPFTWELGRVNTSADRYDFRVIFSGGKDLPATCGIGSSGLVLDTSRHLSRSTMM